MFQQDHFARQIPCCYQSPECAQRHSVRGNLTGQHLHCETISQAASYMNNQWEFSRNNWKHICLDLSMLIVSSWWCTVTMYFYFFLMSRVTNVLILGGILFSFLIIDALFKQFILLSLLVKSFDITFFFFYNFSFIASCFVSGKFYRFM